MSATQPDRTAPVGVLELLQRAGRQGVPYARIRETTGADPELVLDELRDAGHVVQRTPSSNGVLAVYLGERIR